MRFLRTGFYERMTPPPQAVQQVQPYRMPSKRCLADSRLFSDGLLWRRIGGNHSSVNSGRRRRRTEKFSDLRQHVIRIHGLPDDQDLQLGSVLFKHLQTGFHAHIRQQQMYQS
jgi:hypothetical protein